MEKSKQTKQEKKKMVVWWAAAVFGDLDSGCRLGVQPEEAKKQNKKQ